MSLDTYSNLKTAISDTLDRNDLTDHIDDFIDIAEARHKRDVRIRQMIARESITVNNRQISLPDDFVEAIDLRLLTDPVTVLSNVTYHEMNRRRIESTGRPEIYTITNEIEFDKSPDTSYSGEIVFWHGQSALSDSNTSNDILTNHPDLYLYAACAAAAPFLMDDPRLVVWNTLYTNGVEQANAMTRRGRVSGRISSRVVGDTP